MEDKASEGKSVVGQFWATMQTNDFHAASRLLSDDFVLEWPQSGERIRGPGNFAAANEHYPTAGRWRFTIHRMVAEGAQVVTDVGVTDGEISARAITFSTVQGGRIIHQVEFWPDPFEAADWRAQWVERME
jgi:limonene-1,2-epoxide hydrolase